MEALRFCASGAHSLGVIAVSNTNVASPFAQAGLKDQTRPRVTIGRAYDRRPRRVSPAAWERAQHDKIGELSTHPSVTTQLPTMATIR